MSAESIVDTIILKYLRYRVFLFASFWCNDVIRTLYTPLNIIWAW